MIRSSWTRSRRRHGSATGVRGHAPGAVASRRRHTAPQREQRDRAADCSRTVSFALYHVGPTSAGKADEARRKGSGVRGGKRCPSWHRPVQRFGAGGGNRTLTGHWDPADFKWCRRPPSGRSGLPPTRGDWHRTPSFRSACRRTVGSLDLGCFAKWSSVYVGSRTLLRHAGRLAAELDCRVQAKDRGGWLSTDTTTVPDDVCGPEKRSKTLDRTLKSAPEHHFDPL